MRYLVSALTIWAIFGCTFLFGQTFNNAENPWQFVSEQTIEATKESRRIVPEVYKTAHLDVAAMQSLLAQAPLWFTAEAANQTVLMTLPMPDGTFEQFKIELAPVMEPELAAKYPMIRSYVGYGIDDPSAYLRFDMTQLGFHAMKINGSKGTMYIDPYSYGDTENYVVYYRKDYARPTAWECSFDEMVDNGEERSNNPAQRMAGDCQFRTYRLALACTGEYATFHGGTTASVLAAMNTSMTRVNGVYELDASVHMNLVANNNLLVFLDAATDPYTNTNGGTMLGQNQTTCDNVIGSANYDIGHVFSTGGGGVAGLGVICSGGNKARGVTGSGAPVGDPFDIDYVAHEMGHQFGGNHTFNNSCGGNRNGGTAYEPGSGSTIMAYAGICAPNIQNNSDAYFHAISLQEIGARVTSTTCAVTTTNNGAPTAAAGLDYNIPKSTPFVLTGVGTDPNPTDVLSYCWEQMDNAIATQPPVGTNTGGPSFRSNTALASPQRYMPNLAAVIANTTPTWEVLASVGRVFNFRLTVRDNHPGAGCTKEDDMKVTVDGNSGPFVVTVPNTAVNWPAASQQTITWDVANTTAAPVSCANVDILLSTDGGLTYPITIVAGTPNDGTQTVTVPNNLTTQARIMVKGAGNIFYDISNVNFTISVQVNDFSLDVTPASQTTCATTNAVYAVAVGATGTFTGNVTLAIAGVPAGATATFSTNPVAAPGNSNLTISNLASVASGSYNMTVTGTGSTGTKTAVITLTVVNGAPAAVTLTAPANSATGVAPLPTFTWNAIAGAVYDLQVSTSNTFASTVINQVDLVNATFTPTTPLATNTTYFWRVRGGNPCGEGVWSTEFSFTTSNLSCTTFASPNVPVTISASGTPTVTSLLNIGVQGIITDVNVVNLNISHSYINDLIVKIKSPVATEQTLFTRICGSQNNVITNFDDEATNTYASLPCPPINNGFYQPNQPLSAFDNQNMSGNWTLTISDVFNQDGGTLNSWGLEVCYLPPAPLSVSVTGLNITCFGGSDGSAIATGSGGTGSYTYFWSNGANTSIVNNLPVGVYTVTVTSGSETATATVTINQPTEITVAMSSTAATSGNNGSATATPSGGTPGYSYLWSTGATGATIGGLPAGTYTVTVRDANGCTQVGSVVVGSAPPLTVTVSSTNVSCFGGSDGTATATATGGTGTYAYAWSNGATSATATGLSAGIHNVTVTSGTESMIMAVTIEQPTALTVMATSTSATTGNNGTATATASGGTSPYSYLWSNAQNTATISGLSEGIYIVTATDANGCTATASVTVAGAPLTLTVTKNNVTCFGAANGNATAAATGGTGTYAYAWSNGATTATIVNLAPGTYNVTVTSGASTVTGSAVITQPTTLAMTTTSVKPLCFGGNGTATASATGGTGTKTYLWSNGATTATMSAPAAIYTVTATDANGCTLTKTATITNPTLLKVTMTSTNVSCFGGSNGTATATPSGGTGTKTLVWSTGATSNTITGLATGTYTVTTTDANGCTATGSRTITAPTQIALTTTVTQPTCFGANTGTAKVTATGGTGTKTYLWSNGGTTATITGLAAGNYVVTVTDANNCTASIIATLTNPPVLAITGITSVATTTTFKVTVTATGGTGTKKYRRSTSATTFTAWQTSNIFNSVPAGTYVFEVTDAKLCVASQTQAIPVTLSRPNQNNAFDAAVEIAERIDFTLTPNPAANQVQLVFAEKMANTGLVEISDATGKIVQTISVEKLLQTNQKLVLQGMPSGLFFVTLRLDGVAPLTKRLIVQQ